jgi:hypothetical protein
MNSFEINKKRSFKIMLNSYNTDSYHPLVPTDTGTSATRNVAYKVDFRQVIQDPADFNKQYRMKCSFISNTASQTETGITPATRSYSLHVDMGKSINVITYRTPKKSSFILPVITIPFGATASTCFHNFTLNDSDQEGAIINDIRDISFIGVSILESFFPGPNNIDVSFTPGSAVLNYLCMLTFEEC